MAISPKQILINKNSSNIFKALELESILTDKLEEKFEGEEISIDEPEGFDKYVIEMVLQRFRAAGWTVHRKSWRNEPYFTFSMTKEYGDGWR